MFSQAMLLILAAILVFSQTEVRQPVILAIGDSMTAGYGVAPESSYPAQLQKALNSRGYPFRVVNQGVTGSTSAQALGRLSRALSVQADIVIIQLGGNDAAQGIPRNVSRENLRTMFQRFKPGGARVFFAGGRFPHLDELAKELQVPVIDFLDGVSGRPNLLIDDGRHPSAAGYAVVVSNILQVLEPYLATATLFEGARLITGDGGAPIENSAFVIENNRFARVGKKGEVQAPPGARRVDLTGKTVIPAIIDGHSHPGYTVVKTNQTTKETYSRDNLVDHLRRLAYYGVAATMSMGVDLGDAAFQVRANPVAGAALLLTAGGGIALPGMGPGAEYRKDAAYGVTTEAEARKVIQELAAKKVDLVKFWVDDRNGTVKKLPPNVYRALIDEAHKRSLRTIAHIYYLEDAKDLMRAGVDGFAHGIRDKDIDDEFMGLLKQRTVFFTPNLPERPLTLEDLPMVAETVPAMQVEQMRAGIIKRGAAQPSELFNIQARNLKKISDARVAKIGLGTDSGVSIGWTTHSELADMVAAGMTPAQVITAATKTTAEILNLNQLGTIAPGKSADFVVLDANPLDDIKNSRRISRVYVRGQEMDRAALRRDWIGR